MEIYTEKLRKDEKIEKRIETICSFNNAKCNIINGKIIFIKNTNVSFIEPHRIIINKNKEKVIVLYFDEDNIFLYDRRFKVNFKNIDDLLKHIGKEVV